MEWRKQSDIDEPYCAVHNVDCPLHSHSGDPWVLNINPMRVPSAWICPQAVIEVSEHADQARRRLDENEPSALGVTLPYDQELAVQEAFKKQGWHNEADIVEMSGVESLTAEQVDGAIHCLEQIDGPDEIVTTLIEAWEDYVNEH